MHAPKTVALLSISLVVALTNLRCFSMNIFKASCSDYESCIGSLTTQDSDIVKQKDEESDTLLKAKQRVHNIEQSTDQRLKHDSSLTPKEKRLLRELCKKVSEAALQIAQQQRQEMPPVIEQPNMLEPIIAEHLINDGLL